MSTRAFSLTPTIFPTCAAVFQPKPALGPDLMRKIREDASRLTRDRDIAGVFDALAQGDATSFKAPRSPGRGLVDALEAESFRCLIDDDTVGAAKAGAAAATIADYLAQAVLPFARERLKTNDTHDWRILEGEIYGDAFAWIYDFLYNNMTPRQQASIRAMLARATDKIPVQGLRTLPGMGPNRSNWIPLVSSRYLNIAAAIEGRRAPIPTRSAVTPPPSTARRRGSLIPMVLWTKVAAKAGWAATSTWCLPGAVP